MTEPSYPSLDVEQLIQRIREEVAQRQQVAPTPPPAPPLRQWRYSLGELLRCDDVEFVKHIYRCVLQREPDPDGLRDHLSRLRNGECSPIDLLRHLRFSPEGEQVGVEISGLWPPVESPSLIPPILEPPVELPIRDHYTLGELLQYRDEAFVRNAYRALLHREPDELGLAHHLEKLRSGVWTRLEVIEGLRLGPEGRAVAVKLTGGWEDARAPSSPLPLVESAPCMETPRPGEKSSFTLTELLELSDTAFVTHAYRALLRREPDAAGQRCHLERLQTGQSTKIQVLGQLRYSREGRQQGVAVPGLGWPFALQTAFSLPVIGDVLALAALILRPRQLIARLRRLEAREDQFRAQASAQDERASRLTALLEQTRAELVAQAARQQRLAAELAQLQQLTDLQAGALELEPIKQGVRDLAQQWAEWSAAWVAEWTQVKWLTDAKANGVEVRALRGSVDQLARDKANATELAEVRQALEGKAEAAHLTQAWQALEGKAEAAHLTQAWQALEGKAEAAHLATLAEQMRQALEGKAEAAHLAEVWPVLAGKAEAAHLATLADQANAQEQARQAQVDQALQHMRDQLFDQRRNLVDQQRRLGLLLEEARKRLPAPLDEQQLATFAHEQDHRLDALYVSFEDQFRGTRSEIQQRLQVYLPYLRQANAGWNDRPIVDLGCGRGEWLELLMQQGFAARGLDLNQLMVAECRERGLWVDEADALAYLRALPDASLGAVTGFHIIEHLPLAVLVNVVDEALRVVRPGGLVIFETPNPENLRVSAYNFYFDPTHRHPLPPLLSSFLLEGRGWTPVEIVRLNPYPEHQRFSVDGGQSQVTSWLNEVFCGPQDYAVIGYKP